MNSNNIVTYLLTYLRNAKRQYTTTQSHTTQLIYDKETWKKFKSFCMFEGTNPNKLLWAVVDLVVKNFDNEKHTLDNFIGKIKNTPKIDAPEKDILEYLENLAPDKLKEFSEKSYRLYIYSQAIADGQPLDNYIQLWRKYR